MLGLNPKTMLIKAHKHLEQWDYCLRNKDVYLYFSKITTKDNQHMREHLQYQRFRVWYCSLPAYPPTCLFSNLCISTILTPTLTHSQAFVLMSPLPKHLSLTPPPPLPTLLHEPFLFTGQQVLSGCVYSPPPRSYPSLSLRLSFPFSLFLCFSMCLPLSVAAGRRREDAITAAHEGGWKKKKKKKSTQGKQLQSPQGCQLQSPPTSGVF